MNLKKFTIRSKDFIEFKRKNLARRIVTRAIRNGELIRSTACTLCKEEKKVSAHHIDYGKPLAIVWLCDACHGMAHRKKHPLNPKNNKQTPNDLLWDKSDSVQVAFHIPIKNFIALKKLAEEEGISISKIIRGNILKDFPYIFIREIQIFGYWLLFELEMFKAIFRFLKFLPQMLKRRKLVMKKARVSASEMKKWVT